MWLGIVAALMACALWGVTYVLPALLPNYDVLHTGLVRCIIVGTCAICITIPVYKQLKVLKTRDWIIVLELGVIGSFINFLAQLFCSAWSGPSVSGMTTGAIPVLVAIISNERDRRKGKPFLSLHKLLFPLGLLCVGFILCNFSEFQSLSSKSGETQFIFGVILGITHTLLWTWYPIVNADWLQEHPNFSSSTWATLQCASLLPVGLVTFIIFRIWVMPEGSPILGDTPYRFVIVLLLNGFFCSIVAMSLWNVASKYVPTSLVGQMMVFETIFAVIFGHIVSQKFPTLILFTGVVFLTIGVSLALHMFNKLDYKTQK